MTTTTKTRRKTAKSTELPAEASILQVGVQQATVGTPPAAAPPPANKLDTLASLLRREQGATIPDMVDATGWQEHSVRGALAGALKKKGLTITSQKPEKLRVYRAVMTGGDEPSSPQP